MIRQYGRVDALAGAETPFDAVWLDMLHPTKEEEESVEAAFGIDVPTREEVQEIELSSRLYVEGPAVFMTANVISHTDGDDAVISPLTLILAKERLITLRYEEPRAIANYAARCERGPVQSANLVAVGLLESVVERLADILERAAHELDTVSAAIFREPRSEKPASATAGKRRTREKPKRRDFQSVLEQLGRKGDLLSKIRESLTSLLRVVTFFAAATSASKPGKEFETRLKSLTRDIQALTDHAGFINQKNNFLLEATLGMINIEQNAIIKIFSVAAVVFLPPTLIASIYGMNFRFMPELEWPFGYPFAILLMVISAILPFYFFKRRGWL